MSGEIGAFPGLNAIGTYGRRVAVIDERGKSWSFADLSQAARRFAAEVGEGRTLLLLEARNDIRSVIAILGALEGRHPVILAPPGDATASIAALYRPQAIVRAPEESCTDPAAALERDPSAPPAELSEDLALLLSTSGSTGSPKLVRLSLASLEANAASIATYLGLDESARAITSLPLSYSYGLSVLTSHLVAGGSLVLNSASVIDPEFRQLCDRHRVTGIAGVPYSYELMERSGFVRNLPGSITTLTQAGGRLPPHQVASIAADAQSRGVRFYVMYGQTEATARIAYVPPAQIAEHPDAVGMAIPGGRFWLEDDDGVVIERTGIAGELVYEGPNVMLGYAEQRADLAKGREMSVLHTGDVAIRGEDGLYRIVGRKSRFVKLFGLRIGLDDVERQFRDRGIEAVVTGDDTMLAVLVPEGSDTPELSAWLSQQLRIPVQAVDVAAGEAPRLGNGKIDFGAIRTAAQQRRADSNQPAAAQGDAIATLFAELFPGQPLPRNETFVSLGGDSLKYVQVSMGLEEALGYIPADWEMLSIEQLTALPRKATHSRGLFGFRGLETDILVRALAIIAVVINHASSTWVVGGGANVLLLLFGLNFRRYSGRSLSDRVSLTPLRNFFVRVVLPYYALLLAFDALTKQADLASLLLVSNFTGRFGTLMEPYWFIEVVAQLLVLMTLLFAIPPVRRASKRYPWGFSLAFLVISCAVSLAATWFWPRPGLSSRTPELLLWLAAAGWAVTEARTPLRRIVLFGVIAAMTAMTCFLLADFPRGYLHQPMQVGWIIGSTALLLWLPRLSLPGLLRTPLALVAGASLQIYLVHNIVTHEFLYVWKVDNLAAILAISLAAGIMLRWAQAAAEQHLAARRFPGAKAVASDPTPDG
jgi:acyl-CoA synthetase (AMP-forming)/AMP-acid ligase II